MSDDQNENKRLAAFLKANEPQPPEQSRFEQHQTMQRIAAKLDRRSWFAIWFGDANAFFKFAGATVAVMAVLIGVNLVRSQLQNSSESTVVSVSDVPPFVADSISEASFDSDDLETVATLQVGEGLFALADEL